MPPNVVDLKARPAPIEARVTMGGALPFDWVLYDYAPAATGWTRTRVGGGRDDSPVVIEASDAARLAGHRLVWSIAAVDFDTDPVDVVITVSFTSADAKSDRVADQWTCTRESPTLFVTVQVAP